MATTEKAGPLAFEDKRFEDKLWAAADLLRSNLDPAEYKHVVLGLIFLKSVSQASQSGPPSLFTKPGVFHVPSTAHWNHLLEHLDSPDLAAQLDQAMAAIERANPVLRGALPREFARLDLPPESLAELVHLIAEIGLHGTVQQPQDTLGRVYEYFVSRFASAEGRGGGEFYTPASIVRVLVEMLEPFSGRVYDPCCGSGGMFLQSLRFIQAHGGRDDAVSVFGQESNPKTWRMARMNLALRGIAAQLGPGPADTLRDDLHPDLQADYVLANPPFNISRWGGEDLGNDPRWSFGKPPPGNANFAWVQHILHHLAPTGTAGIVLANGSMTTSQSGEGDIRRALVQADLIDCMVALPGQLFYATQIPVCLWFLARDKSQSRLSQGRLRDRRGETLFIDATSLGHMETRTHRVLAAQDIQRICDAYHGWRHPAGPVADVEGFSRSVTLKQIEDQGFALNPGRYVGAEKADEHSVPLADELPLLFAELAEQQAEAARLDAEIASAQQVLGLP
jgi:type I restriction enzyme M protein